jgi:hypothetical protein
MSRSLRVAEPKRFGRSADGDHAMKHYHDVVLARLLSRSV